MGRVGRDRPCRDREARDPYSRDRRCGPRRLEEGGRAALYDLDCRARQSRRQGRRAVQGGAGADREAFAMSDVRAPEADQEPDRSGSAPDTALGLWLERICTAVAMLGGVVLVGIVAVSSASVIGRSLAPVF